MDAASISELLTARLRADGDKPLVTAYDAVTGDRTELSVATLDNWVSKTANLLVEELEIEQGDDVGLLLGTAWTTPVLLLACWRVGAVPLVAQEELRARAPAAVFVAEERVGDVPPATGGRAAGGDSGPPAQMLVVGRGLGARLSPQAPTEVTALRLFADEVLAFADDYADPVKDGGAPAWAEPALSQSALLARAADWPSAARVLTTAPADALAGAVAVVGAIMSNGSLVLVRTDGGDVSDASALGRIADAERVTHLQLDTQTPRPL